MGTSLPLAAADRSMATRSVIPYLPSKYRIIVASSMLLLLLWLLLSILADYNQELWNGSQRLRGEDAHDMRGSMSRWSCENAD